MPETNICFWFISKEEHDLSSNRDDFNEKTVVTLRERAASLCSNPDCRCLACGPNENPEKATRIGAASHIRAAAPGGPRYDPDMTAQERRSAANGIWLCRNCAEMVDRNPRSFSADLLGDWKRRAELWSAQNMGKPITPSATSLAAPQMHGWDCPFCQEFVPRGAHVCRGCLANVVYGLTQQELANISKDAGIGGAAIGALLIYGIPTFLNSMLGTSLSLGWGMGIYALPLIGLLAVLTAHTAAKREDKRARTKPPRFFRHTVAAQLAT